MRWVIAGGGTGGHLFPGMAVAEAFLRREAGNEVLFVGTERGIEARVLKGGTFPLKTIRAMPLKGKSAAAQAKGLWNLPLAIGEALAILRAFRPHLVLGVGGYASGPVVMAASLPVAGRGVKRAIHEQNVIPGMTNRTLGWFVDRVFISFEEARRFFPGEKTVVTGNPVRRDLVEELWADPGETTEERAGRFTVFVFGGSAGAHRINLAMTDALDRLKEIGPGLAVIHQTGRDDFEAVSKRYAEKGVAAEVVPFIEKMASCYRRADLVLCRAGAGTVAELAVCGRPAVFVPYPFSAHDHQVANARRLVERGAARMILDEALTGETLSETLLELYRRPEERDRMAERIREIGRPRAADEIVDHCYALLGRTGPPQGVGGRV